MGTALPVGVRQRLAPTLSVKARQADKRRGSVVPVFVIGLFDGRGALCGVSVEEYVVHIVEIEIGVRDVRKGDRS